MKKTILFLLFTFLVIIAKAQVDTVCYRSTTSTYQVPNVAGNTYNWTVATPGIITSGQGTNIITVNWGTANPGLITNAVSVFATNQFGCVSPPVLLDVFVLNIVPTVAPIELCFGQPCVTLSGTPVGGTWSGIGVNGNQFCPIAIGNSTITYTYSLGGCVFTATGTAVVNPLPTISPIQHD